MRPAQPAPAPGSFELKSRVVGAELVRPARQARSRMTRDRLLAAGRHLLERGAFEATSIADIAAEAGCSVGAFYQRFADKEAFFAVVMQSALAEIVADAKRTATEPAFTEGPIEDVLRNCVVHWVQSFRQHRGLIRTMMKKTLHTAEETWTPLREAGVAAVETFIVLLAAKSAQAGIASFRHRALVSRRSTVCVYQALRRTRRRTGIYLPAGMSSRA